MADWLLGHQASVLSALWVGSFALVAIWETYLPRRAFATSLGSRWFNQIALTALGSLFTRVCLPVAAFSMALLAEQRGWGLLNRVSLPFWASCALGILAIDLATYAQHRLLHAVPLLWRFHRVHHCDLDVDCGTSIRHHPGEMLIVGAIDVAWVAATGAPPLAVLIATSLAAVASVFNHANARLSPALDRAMRSIVVTPDVHRIHHSLAIDEGNRNFSNLLSWWDRLFGTYQRDPVAGHERMELGIADARMPSEVTLWQLLLMPLRRTSVPTDSSAAMSRPELSP